MCHEYKNKKKLEFCITKIINYGLQDASVRVVEEYLYYDTLVVPLTL